MSTARTSGSTATGASTTAITCGFMYTENSNKRTRILDRDIEWQGETIPVNASVESEFGFYVVEVAYEYDFSKREDRELVLSAGLHYTAFNAGTHRHLQHSRRRWRHHHGGQRGEGRRAPAGDRRARHVESRRQLVAGRPGAVLPGQDRRHRRQHHQLSRRGHLAAEAVVRPRRRLRLIRNRCRRRRRRGRLNGSIDWTYSGPQFFFNFAF